MQRKSRLPGQDRNQVRRKPISVEGVANDPYKIPSKVHPTFIKEYQNMKIDETPQNTNVVLFLKVI